MGAVASFVGDVVGDVVDVVGDVAEDVVQAAGDAVESVGDTVEGVVEGALEDPIGTMATVATAVYAPYMLPAVSAGRVVANGGDLDDALKAAAISYAAQGVGQYVGGELDAATRYGTDLGSQQTAMLAAQDAGLGMTTALGGAGATAAGAATGALLSGGDVGQAVIGALSGYGARLGMDLGLDAAGRVINQAGDVIADSFDELKSFMGDTYGDQPGDFPLNMDELRAADLELAKIPSFGFLGDQEGDFPLNEEELAAADDLLATMPSFEQYADQPGDFPLNEEELAAEDEMLASLNQPIGDQEGDFPLNEEELAAADEELAKIPAFEEYADQPGDYDTTEEERLASEEVLAGMPGANELDLDPLVNRAQKYLKDQFRNSLLDRMFGSDRVPVRTRGPANAVPFGLSALMGTSLPSIGSTIDESPAEEHRVNAQDIELFNPLGDANWAPLSKLSNLGEAGKYVNQEKDTYFTDPEFAKRQSSRPDVSEHGWEGFGESFDTPESEALYFNYEDPNFFGDVKYAAAGGPIGHNPEFYSEGGASMANRYVKGGGNGTSDSVPAMLATGEFVIPADVVSGLGNGDNDAGAKVLDEFMKAIRTHKRSTKSHQLPPDSKGALAYLQEAQKKVKK